MAAVQFIREFLASPGSVGAILPSSPALARHICAAAELDSAEMTVEFGPGTGAFTEEILKRLPDPSRFFAIESNPNLADAARRRCPAAIVLNDCATSARKHLESRGRRTCDRIISGLPFASFSAELQNRLLDAIMDVLAPGGFFLTFAYLQGLVMPAGRRFKDNLGRRFGSGNVITTPTVWANLPPAFVYKARRPMMHG